MQEKRMAGLVADHLRKLGLEVFIDSVRTGCLSLDSVINFGSGMISKIVVTPVPARSWLAKDKGFD
jgi:hypothetical protein